MVRRRPFVVVLAVVALAFAQFAVSAHACTRGGQPAPAEVKAHHVGCHEMPAPDEAPVDGNICQEHCQYGTTSFDNAQPLAAIVENVGPVLRIELAETGEQAEAPTARRLAPTAAPPPPIILFGVLRI